MSEYEEGIEPLPYQFLARNRIVSGLADCVVIIEAARRSGTLSTAAHALNQGKDVFAVPGNITSPLSAGCNILIKQGATPIIDIDEFIQGIAPRSSSSRQTALVVAGSPLEAKIIELIQAGERDGDSLLHSSGATASEFNTALTMLEINGVVKSLGQNKWSLS
jgi:DNA processing protein